MAKTGTNTPKKIKLSSAKKQQLAERMFISDGKNAKYIAEYFETTEQTVSRWRKKGNWDDRRKQLLAAPHIIKEKLQEQMELILKGEKPTIDTDALSKVNKALRDASAAIPVQTAMSVIKELDNFISEQNPEFAVALLDYHRKFIIFKAAQER